MSRDAITSQPTLQHKQLPKWCKVCGHLKVYLKGRCVSCYYYHQRHGIERPRHLWDKEAKCKTCGIPLASLGVNPAGRRRQQKGRCIPCVLYIRDHGVERPRRLWGIGEYGWCECGRPATALVDGDIPVCNIHKEE